MSPDPLEELLTTLDVRLHAFSVCRVTRGFRLVFDPMAYVFVHYVLKGDGVLYSDGAPPLRFGSRSVLIVPPGRTKYLAVSEGPARDVQGKDSCSLLTDGLLTTRAGDGEAELLTACGILTATYAGGFGLFDRLPGPLAEPMDESAMMRGVFDLMLEEMSAPGLGTRALVEASMKQCLLLLLRDRLARLGANDPLFFALRDPRLLRAVAAVVARPAAQHTLRSLSAESGMSRSVFVERFGQAYGQSPSEFVQKVRLRHAARLLAVTHLPVKMIARSAGFASRSHFSRVFSAAYGCDPSTYRQLRTDGESLAGGARTRVPVPHSR